MPLITNAPTKTPAQRAAEGIRAAAAHQLLQLETMQQSGIESLWSGRGASPQEICDELGTDAAQAFLCHGILTAAILQIRQVLGGTPKIKLPSKNFTQNPNGTITVHAEPYEVPPELAAALGQ